MMDNQTAHYSIHLRSRFEAHDDERGPFDPTLPEQAGIPHSSLPPVDGGRSAWVFLTGCFLVELVVWGEQGSHVSF